MSKSNVVPAAVPDQPATAPNTTDGRQPTRAKQVPNNGNTRGKVKVLKPGSPSRRFLPEKRMGKDGCGY